MAARHALRRGLAVGRFVRCDPVSSKAEIALGMAVERLLDQQCCCLLGGVRCLDASDDQHHHGDEELGIVERIGRFGEAGEEVVVEVGAVGNVEAHLESDKALDMGNERVENRRFAGVEWFGTHVLDYEIKLLASYCMRSGSECKAESRSCTHGSRCIS